MGHNLRAALSLSLLLGLAACGDSSRPLAVAVIPQPPSTPTTPAVIGK